MENYLQGIKKIDINSFGLKKNCKKTKMNKETKLNIQHILRDTIDNGEKTRNVKNIEVLPISGLMGEAIKRISNSTSVSDLFK